MTLSVQVCYWIAGLVITAITVGAIRRRAVLDVPTERSMHSVPTPRGGGLGIVAGFLLVGLGAMFIDPANTRIAMPLLIGGVPIAAIGWLDDRKGISPKVRAPIHLLCCLLAFAFYQLFNESPSPFRMNQILWVGLSTVACAYFLNIFNFMDGLDGLAGSEATFAGLAGAFLFAPRPRPIALDMLRVQPGTDFADLLRSSSFLSGLLAFCCLGFLIWNWPPAKIFMGDVGSGFLGFCFGFLALFHTYRYPGIIWPWLILLGVFIVDGTFTLAIRFLTRQKWYQAHSLHAFQKAAKTTSHKTVTLSVLAINVIWLLPLAYLSYAHPSWGPWITTIAYLPLILLAIRYKAGQLESNSNLTPSMAQ